jgi:hypothetical protein
MAGQDIPAVPTKLELLKTLQNEQLKHHTVRDAQGRAQFVFSTKIAAGDGEPCLVTEYVYYNATTTDILSRQERVYRWKAAWDANFTFDPTADYDPDGDGDL